MKIDESPLAGCFVIAPERRRDERGSFARTFCAETFARRGLNPHVAQCSLSHNVRRGTLRGLHFQAHPVMEDKLVRCSRGAIFDVAVDIRPGSPAFGRWHGLELSEENGLQFFIPRGFAHGFQALADDTVVAYQIAQAYDPDLARGLWWNDPAVGVDWPLPPVALSERDRALPPLAALAAADLMPFAPGGGGGDGGR